MFSTFEKIKELAKKRGIALSKLEETLGYSTNYFYSLKKKAPNSERLQEIAEYFNVSTDYLLGRTDNPNVASEIVTTADGKPLSDEDVDKIAQIIKLSLGVSDIESE